MSDNNKEVLGLDLDVTNFKDGLSVAKEGLTDLTTSGAAGLEKLGEALFTMAPELAIIAVAAMALKTTWDLVFEGDQIKKTENLFENLAGSFGIAGDALKNDLVKAAGGMADTNSIIEAANKSMIKLGNNSSMLPQIMEVARKTTLAFGGDLTENFQGIATAIASGNARMLRQNGIIIDSKAALDAYAKSLGVTADELNESGRQQAVFNAVMQFSSTNLKNVGNDVSGVTLAWVQLKNEVSEAKDVIATAMNKIFGGVLAWAIKKDTEDLHTLTSAFKSFFGMAKNPEELATLEKKLEGINAQIAKLKSYSGGDSIKISTNAAEIDALRSVAEKTQSDIDKLNSKSVADTKKNEDQKTAIVKQAENVRNVDQDKLAADREKKAKEALEKFRKLQEERSQMAQATIKLQEQNAQKSVQMADSETSLALARDQREVASKRMAAMEKQKIDEDMARKGIKDAELIRNKKEQIDLELLNKEKAYDKDYQKEHSAMLQNQLNESKNVFDGIANAARVQSDKATQDLKNFGKQGELVTSTFEKEGTSAFESFGKAAVDHSQSASQIMKGFFLNSLADIAQAEGQLFLVAGLGGNYAQLAAGAALLTLSGVLRALAGAAGGGGGSIGSLGSSGGGSSSSASGSVVGSTSPTAASGQMGSLTLNIQGDYLNTAETQRTLLQAIQNATDQTGFQYLQVGQTGAQT